MAILNERIKNMRLKHQLTLLDVANYLNIKEATVQRYESGEITNIKHNTIVSLAKLFKCSPVFLMGWENETFHNDQAYMHMYIEQQWINIIKKCNKEGITINQINKFIDAVLDK